MQCHSLSEIANRLGHFDDAELLLEKAVEFNPMMAN